MINQFLIGNTINIVIDHNQSYNKYELNTKLKYV